MAVWRATIRSAIVHDGIFKKLLPLKPNITSTRTAGQPRVVKKLEGVEIP
jgi:hypothetical protein